MSGFPSYPKSRTRLRGQSFAAFLILFVIIIFAFAILGDFSRAMAGLNKARDLADNAALAAANSIDAAKFNRGRTEINVSLAKERAQDVVSQWLVQRFPEEKFIDLYLQDLKISSPDVFVTVSGKVQSVFGNFFGVGSYPITVRSHAQLVVDIQAKPDSPPERCSFGGSFANGDLTINFDCLNPSVTVTYRKNGSPATSQLVMPMLKVDRDEDMAPRTALAFTPILFAPQWVIGRAAHRIQSEGTYRASDLVEYRNIRVYIQAAMTKPTTNSKLFSFVYSDDQLILLSSDAHNLYRIGGKSWLFSGRSLKTNNPYFASSPAWQLSGEKGGFGYFDFPGTLREHIDCSLYASGTCGTVLNLSGIVTRGHSVGTISHFQNNQSLRPPDFVYLYPGESSRRGAFTDSATGQPAYGVMATTAWDIYVYIEGDKWEYREFTDTYCDPQYLPWVCNLKEYSYWKWVEIGWENIPDLQIPVKINSNNSWQTSRVLFDGTLSDAFTIPVFQALSILK
jgi:hypothetical protein